MKRSCIARRAAATSAALLLMAISFAPAVAQAQSSGGDAALTLKLIQLLIDKGVLTKDQAGSLLQEAQSQAHPPPAARKPRAAAIAAAPAAPAAAASAGAAATSTAAAGTPEPVPPGTVRVTYVPQIVRDQIASEVRQEVMQQAEAEHWAAPNALPEWTQRFKLYGDMRLRGESDLFSKSNYDLFPDFNAINNGGGFDTNGSTLPPLLNTTENRNLFLLRTRLGVQAKLDDWINADIRIATGSNNSPVSQNQPFGQNGNFPKYAIWLDLAYLTLKPVQALTIYAGRQRNPFWTSNLMFDDSLNMDGLSAQGAVPFNSNVDGFATAGAFPVFNSAFNFSSFNPTKFPSRDKYMFAAQGGVDWKINDNYASKFAVGYFSYYNIQGEPSSPCLILTSSDACNTDQSRPQFLQFGNTLFPIRTLLTNPNNPTGPAPQYYGLASKFGILDLHGRVDIKTFSPVVIRLEGDFADNLAYDRALVASRGPVNNLGNNGLFQGGSTAYMARAQVGTAYYQQPYDWDWKKGDWTIDFGYKYLGTDSVLDAFNDSNFHEGGTNAKGFFLFGNVGIARNVWLGAEWLSSNQVSGPPYTNDIVRVEVNAKF